MKMIVLGLLVLTSLIMLLGCGERAKCIHEGCEKPQEIGSLLCANCNHELWLEMQWARVDAAREKKKAAERKRFVELWDRYNRGRPIGKGQIRKFFLRKGLW